jgi:Zn/Cd-binding protein ZinT
MSICKVVHIYLTINVLMVTKVDFLKNNVGYYCDSNIHRRLLTEREVRIGGYWSSYMPVLCQQKLNIMLRCASSATWRKTMEIMLVWPNYAKKVLAQSTKA